MRRRPDDALALAELALGGVDDEHELALRHVGDVDAGVRDRVVESAVRRERRNEQLELGAGDAERREPDALATGALAGRGDEARRRLPQRVPEERGDVVA